MLWIVCYDIVNDKRRRKVMKKMEGHGKRVQYSVFECDLTLEKLKRLEKQLCSLIETSEDNIRIYPLNRNDLSRVRLLGVAEHKLPYQDNGFEIF